MKAITAAWQTCSKLQDQMLKVAMLHACPQVMAGAGDSNMCVIPPPASVRWVCQVPALLVLLSAAQEVTSRRG